MPVKLISIDLQNDFASDGGSFYSHRPCVDFIKKTMVDFLMEHDIRVAEIKSDYRQPRRGDPRDMCRPGEWGFESVLPGEVIDGDRWIKSMNSPIWVRKGGGDPEADPGEPYQDAEGFGEWLKRNVGTPKETIVVLFGLTLNSCVLCSAQELTWRGFDVRILFEGTDTRSGIKKEKEKTITSPPISYWSSPVVWQDLKNLLLK